MPLPFEQQPRESNKAFAAFSLYLSLGPQRSTAAVARKLAKSEQLVRRWSAKFGWTERVAAHGAHLALVEREAIEAVARGKSAEWESRKQKLRETEWAMHERAIAAAKRGLDAYMESDKVYANLADIARMLEIASKLGRLATGLDTDGERRKGDDLPTVRVEVTVALEKIYGEPLPGEVAAPPVIVDVEAIPQPSPGLRPPSPAPASEGHALPEKIT
jgi:hypothetical protein